MQFNEVIYHLVKNATVNINQSLISEATNAKQKIIDNIDTLSKNYNGLKRSIDPSYNNDINKASQNDVEKYIKDPNIMAPQKIATLKNTLLKELREMSKYESGRILLNMVGQLIEKEKTDKNKSLFKVDINGSGLNSYDKNSNTLNLSFSNAIKLSHKDGKDRLYLAYPLIHGTIDLKGTVASQKADSATTKIAQNETKTFIESKKGLSPYFITIFHELNHYKDNNHFLSKVKKYVENNIRQYGSPNSRNSSIVRAMQDFNAPTEHRVVWDADPEDISELTLRMEAKEPLRYLYQDANYPLYETLDQAIKYSIQSTKQLRATKFNNIDLKKIDFNDAKFDKADLEKLGFDKADLEKLGFKKMNLDNIESQTLFLKKIKGYYEKLGINPFTIRIPFSTIDATQNIRAYIKPLPKTQSIEKLNQYSINYLKNNVRDFFPEAQQDNMRQKLFVKSPSKRKGSF